ncbi:MAG: c-type cytochrome [Dehalococcoidia bacterium]|nr:c-type cytochrome [Dehalococcoidia bacterium]
MKAIKVSQSFRPMLLNKLVRSAPVVWGAVSSLCMLVSLIMVGCSSQEKETSVHLDIDARRPVKMISEYNLFTINSDLSSNAKHNSTDTVLHHTILQPNQGVISYTLNNSHFVDGAQSRYYLYLPPDAQVGYREKEIFEFPVGTILVQVLTTRNASGDVAKDEQLIEIRLLIHQTWGWMAVPYLWDAEEGDARRVVVGARTQVASEPKSEFFDTPNMNQCKQCHNIGDKVQPIGTKARYLNHNSVQSGKNQLVYWTEIGYLSGLPEDLDSVPKSPVWTDPASGSVNDRARIWLDVNCASCHNPDGSAIMSGLDLSIEQSMPVKFGVYKPPVATGSGSGGYHFSIEPGVPRNSFLLFRIRSIDPSVMMPPVGRKGVDEEGANLISQWISQIPSDQELALRALNPIETYQASLSGGNAERGKSLFYSKLKCITCHVIDGPTGGTFGPDLAGVGSRHSREYLLESIVSPSAKIVAGYETILLSPTNGPTISGILVSEDRYQVVLVTSANGESITLRQDEIKSRRRSHLSIMPPMANLLTIEEAGDLVAYLASLGKKNR